MKDWIEIFRIGTHTDSAGHTKTWSASDLDRIVGQYDPARHEAPVVIGHPADNAPAYGWVEKLKRSGDTLLAKLRQVQPAFAEMVKSGAFKKRSIALYPGGVLRHVGFLGAQPPAVKGLADIAFDDGAQCRTYEFAAPETGHNPETKEKAMELEEMKEKLAAEKAAREKAEKEAQDFKDQAEKTATEFAESKKQAAQKAIDEFIENGIAQKKILPAWRDKGLATFMAHLDGIGPDADGGEYTFAEGEAKKTPAAWFREFLESFAAHPLFAEMTAPAGDGGQGEDGAGAEDLTGCV